MKRLLKSLVGVALAATVFVSVTGCNFMNSVPIKEFVNNIFGEVPGVDTHVHTLEKQDAVEATCTQAGTKTYYLCTDPDCNMMFSDLNGENEIYAPEITEKKGHSLSKTLAKPATCMETGYEAYYTCTSCRKMFSDEGAQNEISAPKQIDISGHSLLKTESKAATETAAGNLEYYSCSVCKKLFLDADGKTQTTLADIYLAPTADLKWNAMAGVSDFVAPSYSNGVTTFNALNNSAYINNVFVDEDGNSLVGAFNYANANTEYTYSMNIKASGTFQLILFANETTLPLFTTADLNNSPKYGFYIRFDSTDAETNVKLSAALGNGDAEQGVKAKGNSTFAFDGTTENEVRLILERYKADTLIIHIWVNGEEISFTKTSGGGPDKIGFIMRTAWDRNDLINGIGDSYTTKNGKAYPTISCSRGLSDTEGFGAGLGLAVTGNISSNAITGEGQATVVLSHITVTKTGERASHEHQLTLVEGSEATCTIDGYQAYYTCECGNMFSDAEATNRIAEPIVIPASHNLTYVSQVDPTEENSGCKEYWSCSVCSKLYADDKGTVETNLDALFLPTKSHEHSMTYVPAAAATALKDGNVEYWYCEGCKKCYADADGVQELGNVVISAWSSLADITDKTNVSANGVATFIGASTSAYVDKLFAAGLAGSYDPTVANTEYTLTAKFTANSSFAFILFANDSTTHQYTTANISGNVSEKLGYYIIFESDDTENVKLKAAVGNGTSSKSAESGVKAKATANVYFDGTTENTLKVTIERYSVDKVIMHIYVNSEEAISFNMTGTKNADVCGFNLRTAWDRTNIIGEGGIGDSYSKTANAYPTISISRGLSDTEGLGCGLGVSVYGVKVDGSYSGLAVDGSAASVTITQLSVDQTKDQVVHIHEGTLVEGKAATCTEDGYEAYYECACGKLFSDESCTVEISAPVVIAAKHSLTSVAAKESTCEEAGYEAYYECSVCEKMFSDENAVTEIEAPVEKSLAAHNLTKTEKVEATEDGEGNKEYWTCSVCFKLFEDEDGTVETNAESVKIPALGHTHTMSYVDAKAASCTVDGNVAHYVCGGCNKYFEDENGEKELTSVVIEASHNLSHTAAVAATALKDGNVEYWYCSDCETYYADSDATEVLSEEEIVDPATWNSMKDTEGSAVVANGAATFTGAGSSSYVDNIFAAGLAGAYDSTVANTEYTLTAKFTTNSSFAFILFASDSTTHQYTDDNISDNVSEKLGYYIIFESDDADGYNVKLKAAVGNGTSSKPAESGVKAKATANVYFDGTTVNTLKVTIERYSVDKVIMHIYVNSEEAISFNMTGTKNADVCGFNLRTAWDRTNIVDDGGIGSSYNKKDIAYPTLCISRGLSETEGLGCGLGVSVYGVKADGSYTGLAADGSAASVTITQLSVEVTDEQVVAE